MNYTFQVQGSSKLPYEINIEITENSFYASCRCQAGYNPLLCKHLIPILEGSIPSGFVDGDKNAIPTIAEAFKNSEAGYIYKRFRELEIEVKEKEKEMKNNKKLVAKVLYQR